MSQLSPFRALRPAPEGAAQVASVPYDVVTTNEARAIAAENPLSFIRVTRSEVDLPEGTPPYDHRVYAQASRNFEELKRSAPMTLEIAPALYFYRLRTDWHEQIGLAGCFSLEEYGHGFIKKHERTRKDKEDDRTRHTQAIHANAGPVFLAYKPDPNLTHLTEAASQREPLYDFVAVDGIRHTVWRIEDAAPLIAGFAKLPCAYVADGHHRSASAARTGAELREKNPNHRGDEEYNWFLCVLFGADQLNVLPYHRLVRDRWRSHRPRRIERRQRRRLRRTERLERGVDVGRLGRRPGGRRFGRRDGRLGRQSLLQLFGARNVGRRPGVVIERLEPRGEVRRHQHFVERGRTR